uniref:Uncharacterized protein n=1 Tax=Anguilla anguilla TaxID=7936 RepID=A0A0E9QYU1_ANGAN
MTNNVLGFSALFEYDLNLTMQATECREMSPLFSSLSYILSTVYT